MKRTTASILVIWVVALALFFAVARPAAVASITYRADPTLAGWVGAVSELEARSTRSDVRPVGPGGQPTVEIGRLPEGVEVTATRLIVAAWQGSPAEQVDAPERLVSWQAAVRDGRVRFAVPGKNSPLGKDFVAWVRQLDPTAESVFYPNQEGLRDSDELYLEGFRNRGPAGWDAGIVYEDAALQINRIRDDQKISPLLRIFYLEGAPTVRYFAEGDQSGRRLIDALVAPAGQRRALDYGIRPLDPSATSPASLFDRFSSLGARLQ